MSNFNRTDQLSLEDVRRLERNSRFYYEYRAAVVEVLNQLPRNCQLPFGLAVALGRLQQVHEEAEGDE